MDPYNESYDSPLHCFNRMDSNESWKDYNDGYKTQERDGGLSDCTITDGNYDDDNVSTCVVTNGVRVSNSTDNSSERSVHFNEIIEIIPPENSYWFQSCICCSSIWKCIYNHLLSVPVLLSIIMILCILILAGFYFFCYK
jgi:hypothetical protein